MSSSVDETTSPPLWLRIFLLGLALALRSSSRLARLAWRGIRASLRGWREIGYIVWDATLARSGEESGDMGRLLRAKLKSTPRLLLHGCGGLLLGGFNLTRRLLWPATVVGAAAALALVFAQVDAPASPSQAGADQGAKRGVSALDNPFEQQRPTLDEGQLVELRAALVASEASRRKKGLEVLLAAQPADLPLLDAALLRRTKVSAADFKSVLRRVGAAVPDHRGRFTSRGRKKAPKDLDWFEALSALDAAKLSERLTLARQEALYSVALTRALVATGRSEAGTTLLLFAYRHGEAFRDECGRALRAMGSLAVPSLARASLLKHPLTFRILRYANYQLDRLNRSRPELALADADPSLRVEMLHAYGEARTPAAVAAVIARVDDPNGDVRRAARWAALRYVSGRPPRATKRHLKLAGGKQTERARSLYLTYRQLARHELAARLAKLEIQAKKKQGKAEEVAAGLRKEHDGVALAERLFVASDELRGRAHRRRYESAMKLARSGRRKEAVARLDSLLALQPQGSEREEIAMIYLEEGEKVLGRCGAGDKSCHAGAALALGKALALLESGGAVAHRAQAMRLIAEAGRDGGAGRLWRLERALKLLPGSALAQREVDRLRHQRRKTLEVAAGVAGGSGLACLALLIIWRRRRSS